MSFSFRFFLSVNDLHRVLSRRLSFRQKDYNIPESDPKVLAIAIVTVRAVAFSFVSVAFGSSVKLTPAVEKAYLRRC